jgi:RNA polymerase sigma-32 factor
MTTTSLQPIDLCLPVGSLEAYIQYVNQIPLLTQEEEHELAVKFQQNNELAAAKRLILSHLRFVVRVAKGYLGYGLPLADLIQEGNIGLMKAVKRFNPTLGVRLVTFAMHAIKAEIHEYILRNWRIVKIATTKSQRKIFFSLGRLKNHLKNWMTNQEVEDIAKDLGVKPKTVREMEMRILPDAAFDGHGEQEEENHFAPVKYLEDNRYNPHAELEQTDWSTQSSDMMYHALSQLDERSQDIIRKRWLDENKSTLHDLATQYQVSAERIRQLEKNAMLKLRGALAAVVN